jgi:biotin transporter BioY
MLNESLDYFLPQELVSSINILVYILQALGGFLIFFILFSIIKSIIDNKKKKEIRKITILLNEIKSILLSNKNS